MTDLIKHTRKDDEIADFETSRRWLVYLMIAIAVFKFLIPIKHKDGFCGAKNNNNNNNYLSIYLSIIY